MNWFIGSVSIDLLATISVTANAMPPSSFCTTDTLTAEVWQQRISQQFAEQDNLTELVDRLHACLAHADPALRDDIGYQGLQTLLRQTSVPQPVVLTLFERLSQDIKQGVNDDNGVYLPFALLAYSEVVRVDRIAPVLTVEQRQQAIASVATYLEDQHDYRGFEPGIGWRHGFAHAADVLLQLALNPALTANQVQQIGELILKHISPPRAPAFRYGEPHRLARAMAYVLLREEVPVQHWEQQLQAYATPAPRFTSWAATYKSVDGLVYLHNVRSFYTSLLTYTVFQNDPRLEELAPSLASLARSVGG